MSLRIVPAGQYHATAAAADDVAAPAGDEWSTRIVKLIPAEALGLYGSAVALVPVTPYRIGALWVIVAVCAGLAAALRYRATRDPQTGRPQVAAIAIALVSFLIWLAALGGTPGAVGISPIVLPEGLGFAGSLAALLWGTIVPYFYKGDG